MSKCAKEFGATEFIEICHLRLNYLIFTWNDEFSFVTSRNSEVLWGLNESNLLVFGLLGSNFHSLTRHLVAIEQEEILNRLILPGNRLEKEWIAQVFRTSKPPVIRSKCIQLTLMHSWATTPPKMALTGHISERSLKEQMIEIWEIWHQLQAESGSYSMATSSVNDGSSAGMLYFSESTCLILTKLARSSSLGKAG